MANDACDKVPVGAGTEQPNRLCDHALQAAYSPTASADGVLPKAEKDKAELAILKAPALTMQAADSGLSSATIMKLGSTFDRNSSAPQLSGASKLVFDRLQSSGLNPSVEKEYSQGSYNWVLKANWSPEQKGAPDLQLRTAAAVKRQSAEKAAAEVTSFEDGMRAADATVLKAPGLAREAADRGAASVNIAEVSRINDWIPRNSNPGDRDGTAPPLSPAQQKIFDGLKAEGLNPSVEPGSWTSPSGSYSEHAWVMKATWKDGQHPNTELNTAMHAALDREAVAAQAKAASEILARQHSVEETIARIPSLLKQAELDNKDAFGVLRLGSYYPHYGRGGDVLPKLDEYQQRIFDELARRNLSPSIEQSSKVAPPESEPDWSTGRPSWVLAAHRPQPSGTP